MKSRDWYTKWVLPVVDAINGSNDSCFRTELEKSFNVAASDALPGDVADALRCVLLFQEMTGLLVFGHPDDALNTLNRILDFTSGPFSGPEASLFCRRYRLQARIVAADYEIMPLSFADFLKLLKDLPTQDRHSEQWYYISKFAFSHEYKPVIDDAYEAFLDGHSEWEEQFMWHRIVAMHKLMHHTATQLDARLLIKNMPIPSAGEEIERLFFPHFRDQGLLTDELVEFFKARLEMLRDVSKSDGI